MEANPYTEGLKEYSAVNWKLKQFADLFHEKYG